MLDPQGVLFKVNFVILILFNVHTYSLTFSLNVSCVQIRQARTYVCTQLLLILLAQLNDSGMQMPPGLVWCPIATLHAESQM